MSSTSTYDHSDESNYEKDYSKDKVFKHGLAFDKHHSNKGSKLERNDFRKVYQNWLQKRKETLKKLRALLEQLHEDQLSYNKTHIACRKTGYLSRKMKSNVQSASLNFLASVAAFLSDASSGIVSAAQAVNIETYQAQFQEIVDQDAAVTKQLYEARSECFTEYFGIEEVFRKFESNSLYSAATKVSNALNMEKFLTEFELACQKDDFNIVLGVMQKFVNKSSQTEVLHDVSDSLHSYLYNNPATLDACKSGGRAVFGALDALGFNRNQNIAGDPSDDNLNNFLINQDEVEILHLQSTVTENLSQSKLEEKIQDALDTLTSEMGEVNNVCFHLFGDEENRNEFVS